MNKCFYVAQSVREAIAFIGVNTDWIKTSFNTYRNGDESIKVISNPDNLRGQDNIEKIYVDYSYSRLPERDWFEFNRFFNTRGLVVTPVQEI